jgi:hypothetical protein
MHLAPGGIDNLPVDKIQEAFAEADAPVFGNKMH